MALRSPSWQPVVLGLLVLMCAGPPAHSQQPPAGPDPDRIIAEVQRLGGRIERDENRQGKPIIGIDLKGRDLDDSGLAAFRGLTGLRELNLRGTLITDAGLVHLQGLQSLESLDLSETRITDAGLEQLAHLENLSELAIENTAVGDPGLSHLVTLRKLSRVSTTGTLVTKAGAAALRKHLPELDVTFGSPREITRAPDGRMVEVFYGTNRKPTSNRPAPGLLGSYYGLGRGELRYGKCRVSIPEIHKIGVIERPWSIGTFRLPEDPTRHVILRSIDPADRDDFFVKLKRAVASAKATGEAKEAFVFVHGYNVSFEDAAFRTAQMAFDLEFDGPAIMFSWPSQCRLEAYLADVDIATLSAEPIKEFLKGVAKESGARKIHLIAHSMGNLAMTRALARLVQERNVAGLPEFDQILLTAPDVDAEVFQEEIAPHFLKSGRRVTLYASTNDWALVGSSSLRYGRVRLGEDIRRAVGLSGVEAIDASSVDTSLLGHSYFGERPAVISDIQAVIRGEPRERRKLVRWGPDRQFWGFNSLPPGAAPSPRSVPTWAIGLGITVPTAVIFFVLGRLSKWRARTCRRDSVAP